MYQELHRPQFHFTAQTNWINDPNGLVYHDGEYHLFFQHNPESVTWVNMTWGHAVSTDLIHWSQIAHALCPDDLGTIFSGSAVMDWDNASGFQEGDKIPMVAFYTSAGEYAPTPEPYTQSLPYSLDSGRNGQDIRKSGNRTHPVSEQGPQSHLAPGGEALDHGPLPGRQRLCSVRLHGS